MLKYLIIPLSDNAVSFCHYDIPKATTTAINAAKLQKALIWSMKENLSVQFIYPSDGVDSEIEKIIETVDHTDIVPADINDNDLKGKADIVVFKSWNETETFNFKPEQSYVIHTSIDGLLNGNEALESVIKKATRLNVVIDDIEDFKPVHYDKYKDLLENLIPVIVEEYKQGHQVQLNLLTDRIMLNRMNNCNAGDESLTFAPDGNFYICPAFYFGGESPVGNPENGADIKNPQLYALSHAPICRICDAFHCKRCVFLNKRLTLEVNTPGIEQCIVAHIERNASKKLLEALQEANYGFITETTIPEITYLDPFENIKI